MPLLRSSQPPRFQIFMYAGLLSFAAGLHAQSTREGSTLPYPYHPNRPGAHAYAQGGAFTASTGSITSMLFNPAGIAQLEGRIAFTLEAGWNSRTEYLPFFNNTFSPQTHPLQFAGLAISDKKKWSVGAFYMRPTEYALDFGEITLTTPEAPDGSGETVEPVFERKQFGFGLTVARSVKSLHFGAGAEWRRAEVRDEVLGFFAKGKADAVRFTLGSVVRAGDWRFGLSLQSQYEAVGDARANDAIRISTAASKNARSIFLISQNYGFTAREPATVRAGFAGPQFFQRLRVSGDVEYKSFGNGEPIPRWQFYGGTTLQVASFLQLAAGSFTFRKDYSEFVDGPDSEVFLTFGGTLKLAAFRFSASFMEGDVLNENFEGQRFLNIAVGYVKP